MAPIGETGASDGAAGMPEEAAPGGAGAGKKGSYVPPALRGDRAGAAGERMGSKYGERDDFATLRVTNVSFPPPWRCPGLDGSLSVLLGILTSVLFAHFFGVHHLLITLTRSPLLISPRHQVSEMAEEGELRDMFERFGRVTRVFLAKDRETGMAKGFAFISFADRDDAVKACSKMDGFGFKHLILRVEFAKKAQ